MHVREESTEEAAGSLRASVIVPVYNPGPGFDDLIASLDRQTLPAEEFEVLLCDDGSDASTRDRLARVARDRPNVRVLSLPHTGWPGTPRNHGIEAARGTYVFFSDQDDRLYDDALRRMCDFADKNASDVVVGKVVGVGRSIPRRIFRRDIPRAELGRDPILELLTPHKLFRLSFLREHGIRFPDGRVRLEDHLFVMRAYFRASTISVLARHPCYAWVKREGSASSSRIDPGTYFPHMVTVLELVAANTPPGALRDTLLRHWYRGKVLQRIQGRRLIRYPDAYREDFLDVVTPIALDWFGPGVEDGLAFPLRIRSKLLRAGRRDDLLRFAGIEAGLDCRAEVTNARWTRGGKLGLDVVARVRHDGREELVFESPERRSGGADRRSAVWRIPEPIAPDVLTPEVLDAGRDLRGDHVHLYLRDPDGTERRIPTRAKKGDALSVTAFLDPLEVFGGSDPARGGELVAQVRHAGWMFETPLRADGSVLSPIGASPLLAGPRTDVVAASDGALELHRRPSATRSRERIARVTRRVGTTARRILPPGIRRTIRQVLGSARTPR